MSWLRVNVVLVKSICDQMLQVLYFYWLFGEKDQFSGNHCVFKIVLYMTLGGGVELSNENTKYVGWLGLANQSRFATTAHVFFWSSQASIVFHFQLMVHIFLRDLGLKRKTVFISHVSLSKMFSVREWLETGEHNWKQPVMTRCWVSHLSALCLLTWNLFRQSVHKTFFFLL